MMEKPENWKALTPAQKRAIRLEAWANGAGIEFDSPEAKATYQERANLFKDAIELKKPPARVPVAGLGGAFALRRAGIKQKATMYNDWEKAAEAIIRFQMDFQPDSGAFFFFESGQAMELLGLNNRKWAGCGLADDVQYQFVEQEYLKADEYDHFITDPSDFVLRKLWPRMNPALAGLKRLPHFSIENVGFGIAQMAFIDPEVQKAFDLLKQSAILSLTPAKVAMEATERLQSLGFPTLSSGFGAAPYDVIGDNLRGTRGIMTDLFRQPQKVIAATEKIADLIDIPDPPLGVTPIVMMPLHKGAEGFMSQAQYEKFYWPTFKKVMLDMIDDGLIPAPFAEGKFDQRVELIKELPEASTIWFFDQTDMHRAKDILRGHSCIMGNVPITIIATGTAQQVEACCKDLIDYCGKDGGYILSPGVQIDEGREETVRALVDFTKNYQAS